MGEISEKLTVLADRCEAYAQTLTGPSLKDSPRAQDEAAVRGASGGGGKARARMLEQLAGEPTLQLVQVTVLLRGFATLVAEAETTEQINQTAAAAVVRAELETAALLYWLFDPDISAETRCRRFMCWQFADLDQMRHSMRILVGTRGPDLKEAADDRVKAAEGKLLEIAESARMKVRPSTGTKPALLLGDDERPEQLPTLTALVDGLVGTSGAYTTLSTATHGSRWNLITRLTKVSSKDGVTFAELRPGGPPARLAGLMAVHAVVAPCIQIEQWRRGDRPSRPLVRLQESARMVAPALASRMASADAEV